VSIGGSPNLEWELTQIKERGLGQKLCLFTSPIVPGTDTKILNKLRRTAATRAKALDEDWARASETLRRAGFSCGTNPGAGAAVTFDEFGASALLTTDTTAPAEFIAPVADWFKQASDRADRSCRVPILRHCHARTPAAAEGGLLRAGRRSAREHPSSIGTPSYPDCGDFLPGNRGGVFGPGPAWTPSG
jgi:hypothetical protein